MYDRDTVELFLLALDEAWASTRAAREVGLSRHGARRWAAGMLPRSCAAAPRASVESGPTRPERPGGGAE